MPNGLGTPVGYKLVPSASFPPLLDPASPAYQRAEVIGHTLWVTPYREDERWPCGDFPVQSEHDSGLAAWTRADRPIEDTDVVLWYVFGIHHITRPEDWPVMPSDIVPFWLKPFGFFDRNPALDVPPAITQGRDLGEALPEAAEQDVGVRHGCGVDVDPDVAGAVVGHQRGVDGGADGRSEREHAGDLAARE